MRISKVILVVLTGAFTGCIDPGLIGGLDGGVIGSGGNPSGGAGTGDMGTGGASTVDTGTGGASTVNTGTGGTGNPQTCSATCSTPAGTVQTFTSVSEATAAFIGAWEICSGRDAVFPGSPTDVIGVEYAADGSMYYLVQGPTGPVRGAGSDYQLTWNLSDEGNGWFQLNMHPTPTSGFGTVYWKYSPCPRELQIPQMYGDMTALLVPLSG